MQGLMQILYHAGITARPNEPLCGHSSFRIGGAAALGIFPQSKEALAFCLSAVNTSRIPFLVIGKGSNVLFSDDGFSGAVIFTEGVCHAEREKEFLVADAGISLAALANFAAKEGLSGMEFAHGIPGTLGGGIYMNAGAYGGSLSDICTSAEVFDLLTGERKKLSAEELRFGYRTSVFSQNSNLILLSATLALTPGNRAEIQQKMQELAVRRRASQPLEYPSVGSVFKRPEGYFAGKLIEDAGLKGRRVGGAEVSQKHAGFIVNRGGATSQDVKELIEICRREVYAMTGVSLECEIKFL